MSGDGAHALHQPVLMGSVSGQRVEGAPRGPGAMGDPQGNSRVGRLNQALSHHPSQGAGQAAGGSQVQPETKSTGKVVTMRQIRGQDGKSLHRSRTGPVTARQLHGDGADPRSSQRQPRSQVPRPGRAGLWGARG